MIFLYVKVYSLYTKKIIALHIKCIFQERRLSRHANDEIMYFITQKSMIRVRYKFMLWTLKNAFTDISYKQKNSTNKSLF